MLEKVVIPLDRENLLHAWRESIVRTYPEQAKRHLERCEDRFSNPIGRAIARTTHGVIKYLLESDSNFDPDCLSEFIGIEAVQGRKASECLNIFEHLKSLLMEIVENDRNSGESPRVQFGQIQRIDVVMLAAFDLYVEKREKLAEIRVDETRRRYGRLLAFVDQKEGCQPLDCEASAFETGQDNHNGVA